MSLQLQHFLAEHIPEIESSLPTFTGMVAVASEIEPIPLAVITEDASQGGRLEVWQSPMSQEIRDLLGQRFTQFGEFYEIFDRSTLRNTTAFDVDGEERLLDFTPPPFRLKHYLRLPGYDDLYEYALDRQAEWTIEIPSDSPLAQSLVV